MDPAEEGLTEYTLSPPDLILDVPYVDETIVALVDGLYSKQFCSIVRWVNEARSIS
jgi:hypothetical protein